MILRNCTRVSKNGKYGTVTEIIFLLVSRRVPAETFDRTLDLLTGDMAGKIMLIVESI
jgi:hypothetical protein